MFSQRNRKNIAELSSNTPPKQVLWLVTDIFFFVCVFVFLLFSDKCCVVLVFNAMSTPEGHFVSTPRERQKRDRRDSRRDR